MLLGILRSYTPPGPAGAAALVWHAIPRTRRSAVLILLFAGAAGELRVLLTRRSTTLKSFPGQILLPGGKADFDDESPWDVSLREAEEEIGLPRDTQLLSMMGVSLERLTTLPCYLLRNFLAVKPCVAFLQVAGDLALRLNPGESAGVFLVPLGDFASALPLELVKSERAPFKWGGIPKMYHSYHFPLTSAGEPRWLAEVHDLSLDEEMETGDYGRGGIRRGSTGELLKDVWGLTANILHDTAKVYEGHASGEIGEEELIQELWKSNKSFGEGKRTEWEERMMRDEVLFKDVIGAGTARRLRELYKANM